MPMLFDVCSEAVYASPAEGGAQTALATVARRLGKQATFFVAKRACPHARTLEAARLGGKVVSVEPGYISVVHTRAREYRARTGARLVPFGVDMPEAIETTAAAARSTGVEPDEVWCATGSGVLTRALASAWPKARGCVVQVGRTLSPKDVSGAEIFVHPLPFGRECRVKSPFPSDPRAWEICAARKGPGRVLFWNVARSAVLSQ